MKKKIILVSLFLTVAHNICAQQVFFSPIVGTKMNITPLPFSAVKISIPDYNVIDTKNCWISPMRSILFGGRFEYQIDRHSFSFGYIYNDEAYSRFKYGFDALQNGVNIRVEKIVYEGVKLSKIPFSYNYTWFITKTKKIEFKFHLGCNLIIPQKWDSAYSFIDNQSYLLTEGAASGNVLEVDSYVVNAYFFSGHRLNLSLDFGFNLSFRLSDKRAIMTSLYLEKGFKKSGLSATQVVFDYNNGERIFTMGNGSVGTSLHLKIIVPILLKDLSK